MPFASEPLVLVTGASGFVATHIIKVLLDNGFRVRGTVRNLNDEKKIQPLRELAKEMPINIELVEADLLKPLNWPKAVSGCTYVIHTASPFSLREPKDPEEMIKPAVDGTLNVLKACADAGTVKRVVLTSSFASVMGDRSAPKMYNEDDWTDPSLNISTYNKSKTLAEKAAWEFVDKTKAFELAVVNPGFVLGPLLHNSNCSSADVIRRLINCETPMIAKICIPFVDVRDVALGHLKAMTVPEAAGKRHLILNRVAWIKDLAEILDKEFRPQGYSIPMREAPYFLLYLRSFFDKSLAIVLPDFGKDLKVENSRMIKVLGINPIDLHKTVIDMAYSLIDRGMAKKMPNYKSNL